jgi:hypothetical protein
MAIISPVVNIIVAMELLSLNSNVTILIKKVETVVLLLVNWKNISSVIQMPMEFLNVI